MKREKIKLFCFPYAGGSADAFLTWRNSLEDFIELEPMELPGRGKKENVPFYTNFREAVEKITEEILPRAEGFKCSFYGHSMGSLLIYEIIGKFFEKGINASVVHSFFSAARPPHLIKHDSYLSSCYDDNKLKDLLFHLGGVSENILNNPRFLKKILRVLRADLRLIESYDRENDFHVLDLDISFLWGTQDNDVLGDLSVEWKRYTNKTFRSHSIQGNHFFILNNYTDVVEIINATLKMYKE